MAIVGDKEDDVEHTILWITLTDRCYSTRVDVHLDCIETLQAI